MSLLNLPAATCGASPVQATVTLQDSVWLARVNPALVSYVSVSASSVCSVSKEVKTTSTTCWGGIFKHKPSAQQAIRQTCLTKPDPRRTLYCPARSCAFTPTECKWEYTTRPQSSTALLPRQPNWKLCPQLSAGTQSFTFQSRHWQRYPLTVRGVALLVFTGSTVIKGMLSQHQKLIFMLFADIVVLSCKSLITSSRAPLSW